MSMDSDAETAATPSSGRGVAIEDHPDTLTMGVLSRKWGMVLFWDIATGTNSTFTGLLRSHPGLSPRILTMRLSELLDEDLVLRSSVASESARPAYSITRKGLDALAILQAVMEFTARYSEGTELTRNSAPAPGAAVADAFSAPGGPPEVHDGEPTRRRAAERCDGCEAPLSGVEAFSCSHACTWCRACADAAEMRCPNCGEHLVRLTAPERRAVGSEPSVPTAPAGL